MTETINQHKNIGIDIAKYWEVFSQAVRSITPLSKKLLGNTLSLQQKGFQTINNLEKKLAQIGDNAENVAYGIKTLTNTAISVGTLGAPLFLEAMARNMATKNAVQNNEEMKNIQKCLDAGESVEQTLSKYFLTEKVTPSVKGLADEIAEKLMTETEEFFSNEGAKIEHESILTSVEKKRESIHKNISELLEKNIKERSIDKEKLRKELRNAYGVREKALGGVLSTLAFAVPSLGFLTAAAITSGGGGGSAISNSPSHNREEDMNYKRAF